MKLDPNAATINLDDALATLHERLRATAIGVATEDLEYRRGRGLVIDAVTSFRDFNANFSPVPLYLRVRDYIHLCTILAKPRIEFSAETGVHDSLRELDAQVLFRMMGTEPEGTWRLVVDGEIGAVSYPTQVEAKAAAFDLLTELLTADDAPFVDVRVVLAQGGQFTGIQVT